MQMTVQNSAALPGRPLYRAHQKTIAVRRQLEVASAELGLTNAVLDRTLPNSMKDVSEVRRALAQNEAIEDRVQEAAVELEVVTDLLAEETAERQRLERELASRPAS